MATSKRMCSLPWHCLLSIAISSSCSATMAMMSEGGDNNNRPQHYRHDEDHRALSAEKEDRIIGGELAQDGRYPYAVPIFVGGKYGCAGTLIAKDTVLTAAHCLRRGMSIGIGSNNKNNAQRINVLKTIEHPNYNENTDEYDIGLLFLDNVQQASSSITNYIPITIDIPSPILNNDETFPEPGATAHVMGWGDIHPGEEQVVSDNLVAVDLEVISNEQCKTSTDEDGDVSYANWIYEDMLCTYTEGQDACQGDSGGPLIIRNKNAQRDVLVGVVSWGVGCAFLPGVFSRISASYDWIRLNVCLESTDPPIDWCSAEEMAAMTPMPTRRPTARPTRRPTRIPTARPTRRPTTRPTQRPSRRPTVKPTMTPTASPTDMPSLSTTPTVSPSTHPTISSSQHPSETNYPSTPPSAAASTSPSHEPTRTAYPSSMFSRHPSIHQSRGRRSVPSASDTETVSSQMESASSVPLSDKDNKAANSSNRRGCAFSIICATLSIAFYLVLIG